MEDRWKKEERFAWTRDENRMRNWEGGKIRKSGLKGYGTRISFHLSPFFGLHRPKANRLELSALSFEPLIALSLPAFSFKPWASLPPMAEGPTSVCVRVGLCESACPTCPVKCVLTEIQRLFNRDEMFFLFYFIGVANLNYG